MFMSLFLCLAAHQHKKRRIRQRMKSTSCTVRFKNPGPRAYLFSVLNYRKPLIPPLQKSVGATYQITPISLALSYLGRVI